MLIAERTPQHVQILPIEPEADFASRDNRTVVPSFLLDRFGRNAALVKVTATDGGGLEPGMLLSKTSAQATPHEAIGVVVSFAAAANDGGEASEGILALVRSQTETPSQVFAQSLSGRMIDCTVSEKLKSHDWQYG